MSNVSKRKKDGTRSKIKSMGDHKEFLKRITKTLYYGQLPSIPCLSLPVTEISCEVWSEWQRGRSVRRLHADAAATMTRQACVSPAALVLALLYVERLRNTRPDYLAQTPPADLFLITLMVGNKFLQDDGEDEEVICSEWAASGGMELSQLKKLELQFLSAIDWNVFVNEKSFESGLQWLERRVALKQAQLRGFFTYSDLAASCEAALGRLAAALACAGGLLALLGSALLAGPPCLPATTRPRDPAAHAPALLLDANVIGHSFLPPLTLNQYIPNSTLRLMMEETLTAEREDTDEVKCCAEWSKHRESEPRKTWYDALVVYDWKSFEPWWSRTSVLNWLYRSSLVSPVQRWLERMNEYADMFKREINIVSDKRVMHCRHYEKSIKSPGQQKCVHQWLNLSKLSALVVSMSDR